MGDSEVIRQINGIRINIREKQLIQYEVGRQPCVFWQTNGCER